MLAGPQRGELIAGRYRVVRRLGSGGMGTILEVEDQRFGGRFALKTLRAELACDAESVARFRREARAAGSIGHPHIVGVCDVGELADGTPFLVLELLRGRSLARELTRLGRLPFGRAAEIGRQLCEALGAAHARGIVHRDLKPDNVFLVGCRSGDFVKLLDFGVSKILERTGDGSLDGLTQTGAALGTPSYMSPEQITASRAVDERADLFALGVVLYQAVTGKLPFVAPSLGGLAVAMMTTTPAHPSALVEELPVALGDCILRALARSPDDRFATARELERALLPFARSAGADDTGAALPSEDEAVEGAADDGEPAGAPVASRVTTLRDPTPPRSGARPEPSRPTRRPSMGSTLLALLGGLAVVSAAAYGLASGTTAADGARAPARPARASAPASASSRHPAAVVAASAVAPAPVAPRLSGPASPAVTPAARRTPEGDPSAHTTVVPNPPGPTLVRSVRGTPSPERRARVARAPRPAAADLSAAGARSSPQAGLRRVRINSEWDLPVQVSLACGERSISVAVAALGSRSVELPSADCRVRCSSPSGLPRCPLRLRADTASFTVLR